MPAVSFIPRPRLAFRVGITGARALDGAVLPALRERLRDVLGIVRDKVHGLAVQTEIAGLYAPGPPLLRMLSPLADGADRLAALAALELGYQLEAPLPFPAAEYARDFPDTAGEFRDLLARAAPCVLALDGARGALETRSYEAVGRLVVRNCDLLIAIWDGGAGRGRGGTAEIVKYAARHGLPVWWLALDEAAEPGWIRSPAAVRRPAASPRGEAAVALLEDYIASSILPAAEAAESHTGMIGDMLGRLRRHPAPSPLAALLSERELPRRGIWGSHRIVMRWAAGRAVPVATPVAELPQAPPGEVWAYWQKFYQPVDACAIGYADRYRSSYLLIFALAAVAACSAVLGVGFHGQARFATMVELVALLGILVVVGLNELRRWHPRSIAYRLLAELFRKQQALALLAWSLPAAEAASVAGQAGGEWDEIRGGSQPVARDALVGWYFNAVLRAAPLPQGEINNAALRHIYDVIDASLVTGQADYHARRRWEVEHAARFFGRLGSGFFLLTLAAVSLKFALMWLPIFVAAMRGQVVLDESTVAIGFMAALLPALSAAFVGVRGYAELELVADQSLQMQRVLAHAAAQLRHLPLDAPLASQELGAEILLLAENMLRDIKGWAQLFRIKAVDVG